MRNRLRGLVILWICWLFLPVSASAQTVGSAWLTPPRTDAFPRIEAFLSVRDPQGHFVHGLRATNIRLTEDDQSLAVAELNELRPGVQFVVAFNPGPAFGVRNSKGVSRYEFMVKGLSQWARSRQGSTVDDCSLLTVQGSEISHVSSPDEWLSAVVTGTIDFKSTVPNLDQLSRAVDIAADPAPRPGMGRAVLFITPPIEDDLSLPLENLAARAGEQGIAIFVWLVIPAGAPQTKGGDQLLNLADKTGGKTFLYTGEETVPDLEQYLEPLRNVYQLAYNSRIARSGIHQLSAEIQASSLQASASAQSFEFQIEPPNPVFVSPELKVQRTLLTTDEDEPQAAAELASANFAPAEQMMQILVDFPDGRVRPLARTALYVDGVLVATNTEPPFDQFRWNLEAYQTSGEHLLRVEAEDILGLVGSSMEIAVQVTIVRPAQNTLNVFYRNTPVLAGLAILLAGAVLLLVLVIGGRIRPRSVGALQGSRRKKSDPVTQPVPVRSEPAAHRLPNWVNRLQWPQRRIAPQAYAFLTRFTETDNAATATPIPVTADEITLGADPNQATLVVNDPSVDPLHARLVRQEDGFFRLADEGSVAGTWINYTPVSSEGAQLQHGDLIHIGRVGFRFSMRQPAQNRKPVVIVQET